MLVEQIVYNGATKETTVELVEQPLEIFEIPPQQAPTLEERVGQIEEVNNIQDELINISLTATDEVYCMLEPLLAEINLFTTRGNSKMVDMYVAMVQRGLKTIEEVPVRYREQVKKILEQLG